MDLVRIYTCLCDRTRLRVLHLLAVGPQCVCHLQAALRLPQAKLSKHLAYLRTRGLVTATRQGQWVVYALPARPPRELAANLACLQDCVREDARFAKDRERLRAKGPSACLPKARARKARA